MWSNERIEEGEQITAIAKKAVTIKSGGYSRTITLPSHLPRRDVVSLAATDELVLIDASGKRTPEELLEILKGLATEPGKASENASARLPTIGTISADGKWTDAPEGSGSYPYTG